MSKKEFLSYKNGLFCNNSIYLHFQEEDEEVDDSDGEVRRKKRKKKSRSRSKSRSDEDDDIDDDDRDLLKENLGVDFSKKRKRIRMESGSDSSDQGGSDAEHNEQDEIPDLDQGGAESGNESDGFIVDEHGQPLRGEKRKKKTHFFTDENLQMAEDIFGVDCDFGVFAEDDDEEDIEDYEDEDEEVHIFFREIKVVLVSGFKLLLINIQFKTFAKYVFVGS